MLAPWLITRWHAGAPYPVAVQVVGVALVAAGGLAVRKPWWQLAKTIRQGYLMSGAYFVIAVGALIVSVTGPGSPIAPRMFAVLWLGFSIWCLISTVALRRRQKRSDEIRAPSEDDPGLPQSSR